MNWIEYWLWNTLLDNPQINKVCIRNSTFLTHAPLFNITWSFTTRHTQYIQQWHSVMSPYVIGIDSDSSIIRSDLVFQYNSHIPCYVWRTGLELLFSVAIARGLCRSRVTPIHIYIYDISIFISNRIAQSNRAWSNGWCMEQREKNVGGLNPAIFSIYITHIIYIFQIDLLNKQSKYALKPLQVRRLYICVNLR